MPDENILREKARAAVQDGKIPSRRADRTWGGPGVGATCAICELPATRDEMEFEVQFAREATTLGSTSFTSTSAASPRGRWETPAT